MNYSPDKHRRRSIRLSGYDYSQPGAYFITVCTDNRECLFGEIVDGEMRLSPIGAIACNSWLEILNHFPTVELDEYIIMPNHIHAIVMWIDEPQNQPCRDLINQIPTNKTNWILTKNPKRTLGKIIRHYKARTTTMIRRAGFPLFQWQRNYYDHIIRTEKDLNTIREYIHDNATKWYIDNENFNCFPIL